MSIPQFFANKNPLDKLSTQQASFRSGAGFSSFLAGPLASAIRTGQQILAQELEQEPAQSPAHPQSQSLASLRPVQTHSAIKIVTLEFTQPLRRSVLNHALDAMLASLGASLIRAKALLRFVDDPGLYLFNIVHAQRYPAQRLRAAQAQDPTAMVLFLDGATEQARLPRAEDFYRL